MRTKQEMRAYGQRAYSKHKEKILQRHRAYRLANPGKVKKISFQNALRRFYDLSLEQWNKLLVAHAGRCAICDSPAPLQVDHNHKTGKVRGLLCFKCNTAIGLLREDPGLFTAASLYLAKP